MNYGFEYENNNNVNNMETGLSFFLFLPPKKNEKKLNRQ